MFDVIHKHYHSGGSSSETRILNTVNNITRVPHDPICQRCEQRFSYHTLSNSKCSGFVSTGSLMLPDKIQKEESKP